MSYIKIRGRFISKTDLKRWVDMYKEFIWEIRKYLFFFSSHLFIRVSVIFLSLPKPPISPSNNADIKEYLH